MYETWDMSKNVHHKEGKELVFGGDKAGSDRVAVKIPWFEMRFTMIGDCQVPRIYDEASIGNDGKDDSDGNTTQPDGDLGSSEKSDPISQICSF